MNRTELINYLNNLLKVDKFNDYLPNGLQIEGKEEINNIIMGVSACQDLLNVAVEEKADAVLVHHGYFFKEENPRILGFKRRRIATLLQNDINLIAYHLPLDAHPVYGNNAQLAKLLDLEITEEKKETDYLFIGKLKTSLSGKAFANVIEKKLNRKPFYVEGAADPIETIAWSSGGTQGETEKVALMGVDAFVAGEISEFSVHIARDSGMHYFSAGHHATERDGIQALGNHLSEKFGISCQFVDIENPI